MRRVQPYISAHGYFFPCCWIANEPFVTQLRAELGEERFAQLDIRRNDPKQVSVSPAMTWLAETWTTGSFKPCVIFCGSTFDPQEPIARDNHLAIDLVDDTIREW